MLAGIIFDMDGTLTLTEPLHHRALAEVFRRFGVTYTMKEQVELYAGSNSRRVFTEVFEKNGMPVTPQQIEQCVEAKKNLYTKIVQESEIPLVPGVIEFVEKIQARGIKKIIATGNSNMEAVRLMLEKAGLEPYFNAIISGAEVEHSKPAPDIFLEAARRIGVHPADALVFEDSQNGVKAAAAAGMRCIALATTSSPADLMAAGASRVIKTYDEVTEDLL